MTVRGTTVRDAFAASALAALVVASCTTTPAAITPTNPTPSATITPVLASPSVRVSLTPHPALAHGTRPLLTMRPLEQYATTPITLTVPSGPGQPAEATVWTVRPFRPAAGYAARVAAVFGTVGPGTVGAAPGGSSAWRLWLGFTVLAVNEGTGDVLFFDPGADAGPPRPPGPAQRDPADVFARILAPIGTTIDLVPEAARVPALRGTDLLTYAEPLINGSWIGLAGRDAVVLFATAPNPYDPVHHPGTTIYDADELGMLNSDGRPVQIIHRPFGTLSGGEIYPVTPYGQAAAELRANPARYLRLLSGAFPGEPVTLSVASDGVQMGSAWAGGTSGDITRSRRTLVPVWAFFAEGTSASGRPASALFVVDAVVPELRMPAASAALNVDADALLRTQLTVSVGGHQPWRMGAAEVAQAELPGFGFAPSVPRTVTMLDADTALVSATDGVRSMGFTLRRAFPGLPSSIWYVSEARK